MYLRSCQRCSSRSRRTYGAVFRCCRPSAEALDRCQGPRRTFQTDHGCAVLVARLGPIERGPVSLRWQQQ